jgi:rhodanese-related sulfurtransferase
MKTVLRSVPGLLFLLTITISGFAQETALSPREFEKQLKQQSVQVLDVRTSEEFRQGHINKALQADWLQKKEFSNRVQHLDKNLPILVYCASGVRSAEAGRWLRSNGYSNVYELKGGLLQWKAEDMAVVNSKNEKQLSQKEYKSIITSKDEVLIHFGADWCPPCVKMKPALEEFRKGAGKNIPIEKIDAGVNTQLMKQLDVSTLPTFIFYKNGKEKARKQGVLSTEELSSVIQ